MNFLHIYFDYSTFYWIILKNIDNTDKLIESMNIEAGKRKWENFNVSMPENNVYVLNFIFDNKEYNKTLDINNSIKQLIYEDSGRKIK
jgi:hypothetical protein